LIAVYTGERDLPTLAKEVFEELEPPLTDAGSSFRLDGNALTRGDARICFLNKPNTPLAVGPDVVGEADLPDRLMQEFAVVTEGILTTFAVQAIAAVRRAAHHIIAVFRKELDGCYLAHRCRLPDPEDAKDFATELVVEELRNIITMADVAERCMSADILKAWVDHVHVNNNHVFRSRAAEEFSTEMIKGWLEKGGLLSKSLARAQGLKNIKDIEGAFFQNGPECWQRSLEFARLSSLKREPRGRTKFPGDWRPTLTLGTIVKVLRAEMKIGQPPDDVPVEYLVCVQPRCHSVRLDRKTAFPFQTAVRSPLKFNLVVKDDQTEGTELLVGWKPQDAMMLRFEPDAVSQSVRATRTETGFVFVDSDDLQLLWLGDIKDMKAQRNASELAAHIHTAGVDDFEWLRLAVTDKIDFEVKTAGQDNKGLGDPEET
jgi:hypothetical protein